MSLLTGTGDEDWTINHERPKTKAAAKTVVNFTPTLTTRPKEAMSKHTLSAGIVNIDTANEEVQRLSKRLGLPKPHFIANIDAANDECIRLERLIAPQTSDDDDDDDDLDVVGGTITNGEGRQVTLNPTHGLGRAMNANVKQQAAARERDAALSAEKRRQVDRRAKEDPPPKSHGLQAAIEANIKLQQSK